MSEIEKLLGQCGLPQYYKKLLAANITTRAKLQEKRALLPSLIPNAGQLQHLLDTLDNRQPNHGPNMSTASAKSAAPFVTAADQDEADVDDSLPVPEECDDPVWAELSRWEHVLRRRLRYLSESRSDAMLARSNTYHFSSASGAGRAGGGRAPTAASVNSAAAKSKRIQDTRRQQMQFDHIKTLLAMARNAMKQHRRNAELLATERKHTYRGAATSREEDATKSETDRGVEMVRRILIVLQEDGPTLMDVNVVHRGAEGGGVDKPAASHEAPATRTDEDEEFLVNGKKPEYVDVDTLAAAAAKPSRNRQPSSQVAKQALAKEAEEAMVDIGNDPRRPIMVSQRHLDVLGANALLDRYSELFPKKDPVGEKEETPVDAADLADIDSIIQRVDSALLTGPLPISDGGLTAAILQSHRDQQLLLGRMFELCAQQQASTRELLLRVKGLEEESWAANDAHQKESLRFAKELETLSQQVASVAGMTTEDVDHS